MTDGMTPLDRAEVLIYLRMRAWEYGLAFEFHAARLKSLNVKLENVRRARQDHEKTLPDDVTLVNGCPDDTSWWALTGRIQTLAEERDEESRSVNSAADSYKEAVATLAAREAQAEEEAPGWEGLGWNSTT